jgi:hypothetical protein
MNGTKVVRWLVPGLIPLILLAGCAQVSSAGNQTTSATSAQAATEVEEVTSTVAVDPAPLSDAQTQNEVVNVETAETERVLLAGTNIAKHSTPLDQINFDTFNGSYVALSEATEAIILQLRDAIPPIETPRYENVEAADQWLRPDDIVVGYVDGNEALAYPTRILNYHEIINEIVNDIPVLISYCPLCNSGIVYDRRLDGQVLEFGNTSALFNSDLVMYDKQTFSYWFQVGGDAIVGDLTGQRLEVLPTRFMRWEEWRQAYPASQILSRDTGFSRPYDRDPFGGLPQSLNQGRFPFPVSEDALDPALPAGEKVIGVVINEDARAYPLANLTGDIVNDEIGGTPVAVTVDEAGTGTIFKRQVGDQILTLTWDGDVLADKETGSRWSTAGAAISGPLEGEQLELLAARFSFWFAFVAAFPGATAYSP